MQILKAVRGQTAVVFGGGGFVGRHAVQALARLGMRVIVPSRTPHRLNYLQPMGVVDQIAVVVWDARPDSIPALVGDADVVVNLLGILAPHGTTTFNLVHHQYAAAIAAVAPAMVHVSALGSDRAMDSTYAASKRDGETAVRAHCPQATILRPSIVFGAEDNFFNLFAKLSTFSPMLPLIGGGTSRFQPVFVGDVAAAIAACIINPDAAGKTYTLAGPEVLTFKQLMQKVLQHTGRSRLLLPIPTVAAKPLAAVLQHLPHPLLTPDQVRLLGYDNVDDGTLPMLADLGITPTALDTVLPGYLYRYRRGGRWANTAAAG